MGQSHSHPERRAESHVDSLSLTKSKQRVTDHGEVFTPAWMVEAMLDLVKDETARIDSRFLEPACGSGNFLVPILRRRGLLRDEYAAGGIQANLHDF